ncbi:hypothetical protein [Escherichia marmotae]|uniref:hypothetical protein n=1 Tax=Escherichia marmotae TaxID=1499973 RepID=UPI003D7825AB
MMFTLVKDLLNIPVITSVTLAILAAIAKKYVHFSRRDFFSRSPLEQIEAVKWLRHSKPPSSDPLDVAEQQSRLLSLSLHRDRDLSYRLVAFHSSRSQTYIQSLKAVLRWPGLYDINDGKIYPHSHLKWSLPLMLIFILTIMGSEIIKSYSSEDVSQFIFFLTVTLATLIPWFWMLSCTLKIFGISKKLNTYVPPVIDAETDKEDFSSIINNKYP